MAFCFLHERGVGDCTCNPPAPSSQPKNVSPVKPKGRRSKKVDKVPSLPRKEDLFPSDDSDKENPPKNLPKAYPKHYLEEKEGYYARPDECSGQQGSDDVIQH